LIRKLRLLELVLVASIGLLSWQLRREMHQARAREQALLGSSLKSTPVAGLAPLPKFTPLTAVQYAEAAAKNLFSRDRNPNVILDPTPQKEKPMPPFPSTRGVMLWPGVPPTVVLSEKPGGEQKGYHPGDMIGDWKITSVDNQYVGLEWNGKQFKKSLDELLDKTAKVAEAGGPAAQAQPTSATLVSAANSNGLASGSALNGSSSSKVAPAAPGPGMDVGGGFRACNAGDPSPSGAVVNGFRKVSTPTPFGSTCRWEPAK
jgi:hypothetical protein